MHDNNQKGFIFIFFIFTLIQAIFAGIITCVRDVSMGFSAAKACGSSVLPGHCLNDEEVKQHVTSLVREGIKCCRTIMWPPQLRTLAG